MAKGKRLPVDADGARAEMRRLIARLRYARAIAREDHEMAGMWKQLGELGAKWRVYSDEVIDDNQSTD